MAEYSIGHKERAYVGVESAHGAGDALSSGGYVRLHGSMSAARRRNRLVEDDKRDNAAPVDCFDAEAWCEWSFPEGKARPSGALGTEPELKAFWEGLLGDKNVASVDTTIASAPTVGGATLTAAPAAAEVGDLCRIGEHVRMLTSIAGSDVTWEPDLRDAPIVGTAFRVGVTYKPVADPEVTLNIYRNLGHTAEFFPGCWVEDGSLKWTRDGFITAAFSGQGMGKRSRIGESTLGAAIATVGETTITVAENEGVLFDVDDTPGWVQVGDEVMKVTARAGDVLTVERGAQGTTAATALLGATVSPWTPVPALVGRAVTGIKGFFYVVDGGVFYTIPFENMEVRIQNGYQPRREAGHESGESEFAYGYTRSSATRTVTFNAAFKFKRLTNALRDASDKARSIGVVLTAGDTSGEIYACVLPRVKIDPEPTPDSPAAGDTMLTVTGVAYASSNTKDDQIAIGSL